MTKERGLDERTSKRGERDVWEGEIEIKGGQRRVDRGGGRVKKLGVEWKEIARKRQQGGEAWIEGKEC